MHVWEKSRPFGVAGANNTDGGVTRMMLKSLNSDPKGLLGHVMELGHDPIDMGEIGCGLCATQGRLGIIHPFFSIQEWFLKWEGVILFKVIVKVINQARENG